MSFTSGFVKIAGLMDGLKAAGNETIKDALSLKGARDAFKGIREKYKGKMKDLVKTKAGASDLASAAAKSLPSAAAATLYAGAAKKLYKAIKKDDQYQDQYYM